MPLALSPAQTAYPPAAMQLEHRLRFGSSDGAAASSPTPEDLAQQLHALASPPETPGTAPRVIPAMAQALVRLNPSLAAQLQGALAQGLAGQVKQGSLERLTQPNQLKIRYGEKETVLKNRLNLFTQDQLSIEAFLKHPAVFGNKKLHLIACTGWTQPPVEALMTHPRLKAAMKDLSPLEQQQFAERYYEIVVTEYLNRVLARLKEDDPQVNEKLAFLTGVSNQGIDRAVEEFCEKNRIRYAGVTCYQWAPYIADTGGKPPVYLVENPEVFRKIMLEQTEQLLVLGGRKSLFPVHHTLPNTPQPIQTKTQVLPLDILSMYGVDIPAIQPTVADPSAYQVENMAAMMNLNPALNLRNHPVVKAAVNADSDPFEVFALVQLLKQPLQHLGILQKVEPPTS